MKSPPQSSFPGGRWLIVLFALFTVVWFGSLDQRKLIKPDEGRYAEIAREMAASGDWVTPRLNGIKYFEKPPLQYWATAAAFEAFGENEWTARLWPALTGFLGVLLAFFTGARLFGREAGIMAGAILGSSFFWLAMGHFNALDMGLAFFLQLALCAFLLGQRAPERSATERNWMLAAWAAAALAALSKGLVSLVLPAGTLVIYSLVNRDWQPWMRLHPLKGFALFLAIAAPWVVLVSLRNPEFFHFFFVHEHFQRFLTTAHGRVEPWWYFVPVLLVAALPWSGLAVHGAAAQWRDADDRQRSALRFLVVWSLFTLGFFSLSGSKLPSYILPILPAFALIAGRFVTRIAPRTLLFHLLPVLLLAVLLLAFAPQIVKRADEETPLPMMMAYRDFLLVAGAVWLVAIAAALGLRRQVRTALLTLATGSLLAFTVAMLGHETLSRSSSAFHLARQISPLLGPNVPFYAFGMYDQTLTFYLGRTVTLVNYADEMGFGLRQEPWLAIPTLDEFARRWHADADAFALATPDGYRQLAAAGLPMQVVAQDTRRVVVRKSAAP